MQSNRTNNAIELTRLREITTTEGKTVLYGQLGFAGGRLQITELETPDDFGCTWTVEILPPKKNRPGLSRNARRTEVESRVPDDELMGRSSQMTTEEMS